jgi:uncharacterized protein (DUF2236 family)
MINQAIDALRVQGGGALRSTLIGQRTVDTSTLATPQDRGLFGPDSVTWKINSDISLLIGGLRSLIFQTLHPLAMAGVAEHSDYRQDPFGRLQRTGQFVGGTTFGNTPHAEELIRVVRNVHERVRGIAPDGRPYSANDPRLLLWVHAVEVDSFLVAYKRYSGQHLEPWEADAYVAEMSVVARRLGATRLPLNAGQLDKTLRGFRHELSAGPQAREAWRFLLAPPLALLARGPYAVIVAAAVSSLPGWVRQDLRIPALPGVEPLMVRPAATGLTKGLGWLLSPESSSERLRTVADSF